MLMLRRREVYGPPKPTAREGAVLRKLPPQDDLPPGPTVRCVECGARLRAGTFHNALQPRPHQAFAGLVREALLDTEDEFALAREVQR